MCISIVGCTSTDKGDNDSNITDSDNTSQTESVESDVLNTDLELWDKLTLQDNRQAVDIMIDVIHYTQEKVSIKWKI